jgi:hypothetical protein
MSGPMRPAAATPGGSVALPRPGQAPAFPARIGRAVRALPDHKLVTRLLTGRVWIPLIAVLLFGIVTMQIHLLKLNTGISRAVETSARLERENAAMRASIGRLSSGERQRAVALKNGLVDPAAGSARFLKVRSGDAALAAKRIQKPGQTTPASAPTTSTPVTPTVAQSAPVQSTAPAPTQQYQAQPTQTQQYQAQPTQTQTYAQPQAQSTPSSTGAAGVVSPTPSR